MAADGVTSFESRLADLERRLSDLEENYRNIAVEIGGVPEEIGRDPHRPSMRRRLHLLEDERTAANLTDTAMKTAMKLHDAAKEKRFSRKEKLVALACTIIIAAGSWVAPLLAPPH
jgi:hypothetical protein